MAFGLKDRIRETTTVDPGSGNIVLEGSRVAGFLRFADRYDDGDEFYALAANRRADEWEIIHGRYLASADEIEIISVLQAAVEGVPTDELVLFSPDAEIEITIAYEGDSGAVYHNPDGDVDITRDISIGRHVTSGEWRGTQVGPTFGGTGLTAFGRGALLVASLANIWTNLAIGTAGKFLRSDGTDPAWSTLVLPNAATRGDLPYASASNTVSMLPKGAANTVLAMGADDPAWVANLAYGTLPTGNGSWDTGSGTTITITRALTVTGTLTGTLTGSALSLTNARTFWGQSFNGTANVSGAMTGVTDITASGTVNAANFNGIIGATTPAAGTFTTGQFTSNVIVDGNLTVSGTTVTVNTDNIAVEDPLIKLATANVTDAVDMGFYSLYQPASTPLYTGLFRDATDSKYKLFHLLQAEPTTTVNTGGTGYETATLVANLEGAVTGNASTATALQTARTIGGVSFDGTASITVASATGGFAVSGGTLTAVAITASGNIQTSKANAELIANATSGDPYVTFQRAAAGAFYLTSPATSVLAFQNGSGTELGRITGGTFAWAAGITANLGFISGPTQNTAALTDAGTRTGMLQVDSSDESGSDGGGIIFSATNHQFAAIKSLLVNGSGNYIGDLAFATRNATGDTALTERMRIMAGGVIEVFSNIISRPSALDISGTLEFRKYSDASTKAALTDAGAFSLFRAKSNTAGEGAVQRLSAGASYYSFRTRTDDQLVVEYYNGVAWVTGATFNASDALVVNGDVQSNAGSTGSGNLIIGPNAPSVNGTGRINFVNSNSVRNWRIGSNDLSSGAFEIMHSSANGGSSFPTALLKLTTDGMFAGVDATYDFGATGANRFRHAYLSGNGVFGGTLGIGGVTTASARIDVTGDITNSSGGHFRANSADYDLLRMGARGNSGSNLDSGYVQVFKDGVEAIVLDGDGGISVRKGGIVLGEDYTSQDVHTAVVIRSGTNSASNNKNASVQLYRGATALWDFGVLGSVATDAAFRIFNNVYGLTRLAISPEGAVTTTAANGFGGNALLVGIGDSFTGHGAHVSVATARGTGFNFFLGSNTTATDFIVKGNGDVVNTNNSYGAISDQRLKRDIRKAGDQLADVRALRLVKYRLKNGDETEFLGGIAQEWQKVSPGLVTETRLGSGRQEVTRLSINYSIAALKVMGAVQELADIVLDDHAVRITTLEAAVLN